MIDEREDVLHDVSVDIAWRGLTVTISDYRATWAELADAERFLLWFGEWDDPGAQRNEYETKAWSAWLCGQRVPFYDVWEHILDENLDELLGLARESVRASADDHVDWED